MKTKFILKSNLLCLLLVYLTVGVIGGENFVLCIENSGLAQIEYSECHAKEKLQHTSQHTCQFSNEHHHNDCLDINLDIQDLNLLISPDLKVLHKSTSLSFYPKTIKTHKETYQTAPRYISSIPPPYIQNLKTTLFLI